MEEIRHKLGNSRNNAVLEGAVLKLHRIITSKLAKDNDIKKVKVEVDLLWECVAHISPVVSRASAKCLCQLVSSGNIDLDSAFSTFLTMASLVKCPAGLISGIDRLLHLQYCFTPELDKPYYGIATRTHPLVSLLRSFPSIWPSVSDQIFHSFSQANEVQHITRLLKELSPVLMFVYGDPHQPVHFSGFRQTLLHDLISLGNCRPSFREPLQETLKNILLWLNFKDETIFQENLNIAINTLDFMNHNECIYLPFMCSLYIKGIRLGFSLDHLSKQIEEMFLRSQIPSDSHAADICALILSKGFQSASSQQLMSLLSICSKIYENRSINKLLWGILVTSVLPLISSCSKLDSSIKNSILTLLKCKMDEKLDLEAIKMNDFILDEDVTDAVAMFNMLKTFTGGEEEAFKLQCIKVASNAHRLSFEVKFLLAVALCELDDTLVKSALEAAIELSRKNKDLSHDILSLMLFKISDDSASKEQKLFWMRHLPLLCHDKSCLAQILQIVNSLGSCAKLKPLRLQLLFDIWREEDRIYPHLLRALEEKLSEDVSKAEKLTFGLARAKIMRDICEAKASSCGADLLPLLSRLLNESKDDIDAAICTLALDGICFLCKEAVIDIRTTVKVLWPKLWQDHRPQVVCHFINVLQLVPSFEVTNSTEFEAFRKEKLAALWERAVNETNGSIKIASLKAIAAFPRLDHSLKMLPKFAKGNLKLPAGYKSSDDRSPMQPEDVLKYIPGDVWVQMINSCSDNDLEHFVGVIQSVLEQEIKEFPRGVYYVSPAMASKGEEPSNYTYLEEKSALRAIISHCLDITSGKVEHHSRVETLLKLLSCKRSRPLPPFDWKLLLELHNVKLSVLRIVSQQCENSSSAKRLVSDLLSESDISHAERDILIENLQSFINFIDMDTIKKFLFERDITSEKRIMALIEATKVYDAKIEDQVLTVWKSVFQDAIVNAKTFAVLINCLSNIPAKVVDHISSLVLKTNENENEETFARKFAIKCRVITVPDLKKSLSWLNMDIEMASILSPYSEDFFEALSCALSAEKNNSEINKQWVLELMGRIRSLCRAESPSSPSGTEDQMGCLLETLILAVIIFSGTDLYSRTHYHLIRNEEDRHSLLPLAMFKLFDHKIWNSLGAQLCEWIQPLLMNNKVPKEIKDALKGTISAFRKCEKFNDTSLWGKLVLVDFSKA